MSRHSRDLLIIDILEREPEIVGRNPIAKYANASVSERQFVAIDVNDFYEQDDSVVFVAGRGRNADGSPSVQLWWCQIRPSNAEPSVYCPQCRATHILAKIEDSDLWKIECCGDLEEGGIRDICLKWLGKCQRDSIVLQS